MMRLARDVAKMLIRCRSGTTALEFAIIAPLFFATIMITFDLGRGLYAYNHVAGAVSLGARVITIDGANDETGIEAAIRSKFDDAEQGLVNVDMTEEYMSTQIFKKITVQYDFSPLIDYGPLVGGVTFTVTRSARAGDCTDAIEVATAVYNACQSLGLSNTAVIDKGGATDPVLL